jgi:hypothetical protein
MQNPSCLAHGAERFSCDNSYAGLVSSGRERQDAEKKHKNCVKWVIRDHLGLQDASAVIGRPKITGRTPPEYCRCTPGWFRCRFERVIPSLTDMRSISKRVAAFCLVITLWSTWAIVAHQHSNSTEAAKCTVCVAAHSASPKIASALPKAAFVPVSTFEPEPVAAKHRLVVFALSVRPPPPAV